MAVVLETYSPVTLSAGVAAPISNQHIAVTSVTISAEFGNVGNVYIGGSQVTVTSGEALPEGDSAVVRATSNRSHGGGEEFYLDEIYVVTSTTGNKVRINAFRRRPGA